MPFPPTEPHAQTAVLLLRVWHERDAPGFRSRLVTLTSTGEERALGAASTVDGVLDEVRRWLTAHLEGAPSDG